MAPINLTRRSFLKTLAALPVAALAIRPTPSDELFITSGGRGYVFMTNPTNNKWIRDQFVAMTHDGRGWTPSLYLR